MITLAVTMVVILILAGVALNLAVGKDGIIGQSKDAKADQVMSEENEIVETAYSACYMRNGLTGEGITPEKLEKEINKYKEASVKYEDETTCEWLLIKFKESGNEFKKKAIPGESNNNGGNTGDDTGDENQKLTVAYNPNGRKFVKPSSGNATIETKVNVDGGTAKILQYAWSTDNTNKPTTWESFSSGDTIKKSDCDSEKYYLWVNCDGKYSCSQAFEISDANIKITVADADTWKNSKQITINYDSLLVKNKRVGYATTLNKAKEETDTTDVNGLVATFIGYVYVEAEDSAGNKVYASNYVDKIDTEKPQITSVAATESKITVYATDNVGVAAYKIETGRQLAVDDS